MVTEEWKEYFRGRIWRQITNHADIDALKALYDGLDTHLYWRSTPQGQEYWSRVRENLRDAIQSLRVVQQESLAAQRRGEELDAQRVTARYILADDDAIGEL